jgi:hypothetical protein
MEGPDFGKRALQRIKNYEKGPMLKQIFILIWLREKN